MLRRELLAAGWHDMAIQRQVRSGTWIRVRHGAYVPSSTWEALDDLHRHGLRTRAVVKQAGTSVVVSHASALVEHDVALWGVDLSDVHVTRLDARAGRYGAGVRQHRGRLEAADIEERNGVRVTVPARAVLEAGTLASTEASLCLVNDVLHRGLASEAQLRSRAVVMDQWPGSLSLDLVLRLADGRIESIGESRTFYMCYQHGLPAPVPQYVVTGPGGGVVARLDFAWPDRGVFVEFDGQQKYEKWLRPGERTSDVVIREKQREELVCRLTGWRCVRLTWADLERPARTVAMIRAAFAPASSSR